MRGHGQRDCPRDGTRLVVDTIDPFDREVDVDACPMCDGMFLDAGELGVLVRNRDVEKCLRQRPMDQDAGIDCPACGAHMDVEEVGDEIAVDVCLACYGIWLDGGELAKLEDCAPPERRRTVLQTLVQPFLRA